MDASTHDRYDGNLAALWAGVLIAPAATLLQLQVNYALVPWACREQQLWPLHLTAAAAFAVAVLGFGIALQQWRRTGSAWEDDGGGAIPRSRLMAVVGMLGSALFVLVVIAQWIPVFVYGPCQR